MVLSGIQAMGGPICSLRISSQSANASILLKLPKACIVQVVPNVLFTSKSLEIIG